MYMYVYSIYTLQRLTKCSSEENAVFHSAVLCTFNFEIQEVKKILKVSKGNWNLVIGEGLKSWMERDNNQRSLFSTKL